MNHTLVALSLAVMVSLAHAEEPEKAWSLVTSKQESTGRAIIFRYLSEFPAGFSRAAYPDRVILVWRYQSSSGMPEQRERQRMDLLEDFLGPAVEANSKAKLVLVSTGENLREWIYYAKSEDEFIAKLNIALRGQPAFPIEIHAAPDPTWTSYEDFRRGVKQ
ncbi:DUF695 domain-containing protein [Inhella proteolytica]|uniref:DUF695 domain-containing protein n=1 Tax=Inhella proteolytica TaxID=2795029 RepID=A0A931J7L3_9BURK|nr:DUF695 domain-containing protein [Inhella proteolytica]MBH9579745.1 DUF695 domain-containing protein [Inhella proteolytica]